MMAIGALTFQAEAKTEKAPNYKHKLDWSDKKSLSESTVLVCDDAYYSAFELIIPGLAGKDFMVTTDVDVTEGKFQPDCDIEIKKGAKTNSYIITPRSSSCTIRVFKLFVEPGNKNNEAYYEIYDAC